MKNKNKDYYLVWSYDLGNWFDNLKQYKIKSKDKNDNKEKISKRKEKKNR